MKKLNRFGNKHRQRQIYLRIQFDVYQCICASRSTAIYFCRSFARHFRDPQTWTSLALRLRIGDKTGTLAYPVWCIAWVVQAQLFARKKVLDVLTLFSDVAIQTPTVVESVHLEHQTGF